MKPLMLIVFLTACGSTMHAPKTFKGYCFSTEEGLYCHDTATECNKTESNHRERRPWIPVENACKMQFGNE